MEKEGFNLLKLEEGTKQDLNCVISEFLGFLILSHQPWNSYIVLEENNTFTYDFVKVNTKYQIRVEKNQLTHSGVD